MKAQAKWTIRTTIQVGPAHTGPVQGDLGELRRCFAPGCKRRGVPMVQRWDNEAQAWVCHGCGQIDTGWS